MVGGVVFEYSFFPSGGAKIPYLAYMETARETVGSQDCVENPYSSFALTNSWAGAPLPTMVTVTGVMDNYHCSVFNHASVGRVYSTTTPTVLANGEQIHQT